ncbi:MAG: hypothetical protein DWQ34_08805 [Planctomycetota bacterium]|nr:MAG: hypothetical protein DWQ34_08805 [Planctomycetota bacterium]REK23175.1 MAG: hypothetical protein DWQ41_17250 [Planctomycetota bacterium]REK30907.1 MAG: hypothetical protein DWQ45_20940 [Planctomycetota bacterium]
MIETVRENYSGRVELRLLVNDDTVSLAKIGPGYVVLSEAADFPAGRGRISMTIDGREQTWNVRLPHGAVPFDSTVEVRVE